MGVIMDDEITGPSGPRPPVTWDDVAQRDERIRQLEKLNSQLAAEVDRQRAVAEAARAVAADFRYHEEYSQPAGELVASDEQHLRELVAVVTTYEASREGADGR